MANSSTIVFDDDPPPPIDRVTLAIEPTDAFTGRIVSQDIKARIKVVNTANFLPTRPRRNLTGMLVFVNLPVDDVYEVLVEAEEAGYFNPDIFQFQPLPLDSNDAAGRRAVVRLFRKPDFVFEDVVTLVSGVVQLNQQPVAGALFEAVTELGNASFKTKTDQKGAFALALRLPQVDDANVNPVSVSFTISHSDGNLQFNKDVMENRRHVFASPIQLNNPAVPPFI